MDIVNCDILLSLCFSKDTHSHVSGLTPRAVMNGGGPG